MSTLVEELEQAAEGAESTAKEFLATSLENVYRSRAASLRRRAAWVRELGKNADTIEAALPDDVTGKVYVALYRRLTGPIPAAETAPTERKTL